MYSEEENQCGKCAVYSYRLSARQHFTANAVMGHRNIAETKHPKSGRPPHTTLLHIYYHLPVLLAVNQASFLHLKAGIPTGWSLLTATGQPSLLPVLTARSEFA